MNIDRLIEKMNLASEKDAVIFDDKIYTYGDVLAKIDLWEERIEKSKIESGKVVALTGDYSPDAIALIIALICNKNIIVPLGPATEAHLSEYYQISRTQFVIDLLSDNYIVFKKEADPQENTILRNLIKKHHPGLILFTSGSTGEPKAVTHDFDKLLSKYAGGTKSYRTLCFLLFDHIAGIDTYFYCLFSAGTAIYPTSRNPAYVCELIEKYQVEVLPTSPTFLNLLLISEEYKGHDLSTLKIITFGSERMPRELLERLKDAFPGVRLTQKYGVTELGSPPSKTRDDNSTWIKMDSERFKVKVVDEILYVKADTAMIGYLNAPNPFTDDGWFNTGDSVEVDGDYLRILGRKSEIINVGGEKVYPAEVEGVIQEFKNVEDVMVYGEKNALLGEIVCAKVSLLEPEDTHEFAKRLKQFCKSSLENYKIPVKINVTDEKLHTVRHKKNRRKVN